MGVGLGDSLMGGVDDGGGLAVCDERGVVGAGVGVGVAVRRGVGVGVGAGDGVAPGPVVPGLDEIGEGVSVGTEVSGVSSRLRVGRPEPAGGEEEAPGGPVNLATAPASPTPPPQPTTSRTRAVSPSRRRPVRAAVMDVR
jgi:hypothetical protein